MRDAMLGRGTGTDAGLEDCAARGLAEAGREGDAGGGRRIRGAGGRPSFGGNGKPPTARARVGLVAVGGFLNVESFDFLTPLRARRPVPSM